MTLINPQGDLAQVKVSMRTVQMDLHHIAKLCRQVKIAALKHKSPSEVQPLLFCDVGDKVWLAVGLPMHP